MIFAKEKSRELSADAYLPFIRHSDEYTVVTKNRGAFQVLKIEGVSFRTADISDINTLHDSLSHAIRNIADGQSMIYVHVVRSEDQNYIDGSCTSYFGKWLDKEYRTSISGKRLYRNDIFITVYTQPRGVSGSRAAFGFGNKGRPQGEADQELLDGLAETTSQLTANLARYKPRLLKIFRDHRGLICSEIAQFLRFLITGRDELVPLPMGVLGRAIYTDRVIFGREALEIRHADDQTFGAMFGINEYPAVSRPNMMDDLLTAPFPFVLAQSFRFVAKSDAISKMTLKEGRMRNANDPAYKQADELIEARNELMSGRFVMGEHNMSLLVLAEDMKTVRARVSEARNLLSNSGAVVAREDIGIESSFWAQLPGNHRHRCRPALVTSRNFTALSPLHNYPVGKMTGNEWGSAVCKLKSSAGSPFYFNFHVGDLGHSFICGPTGSGKTVVQTFLLAQLERFGAKRILFDKDRGAEIFVRASGGTYMNFKSGEPTMCAPFSALDLTPENERFLVALTRSMLQNDQHPFTAEDIARIELAVASLRNIPKSERSTSVLRELIGIGTGEADDIGTRLDRWTEGNRLAWVFENSTDSINLNDTLIGFDITEFLDDPEIRNPIMMYLIHRINELVNGQRIAIFIDEFWKALADPYFITFVKDRLKVIRKQNGIIVAGTQSASDVIESPISRTVIEQCANLMFFRNDRASADELMKTFGLTQREFDIVRSELTVGQFLVKQGSNSVVCELDLTGQEDALAVLSGRTKTNDIMNEIRLHHPDPREWLSIFQDKRKETL